MKNFRYLQKHWSESERPWTCLFPVSCSCSLVLHQSTDVLLSQLDFVIDLVLFSNCQWLNIDLTVGHMSTGLGLTLCLLYCSSGFLHRVVQVCFSYSTVDRQLKKTREEEEKKRVKMRPIHTVPAQNCYFSPFTVTVKTLNCSWPPCLCVCGFRECV